ncbi:hypothetical protein ACLK19_28635 [Escherichia coli]
MPTSYWQSSPVNPVTTATPMQWSNGDNAGFTAGEPWIGLGNNFDKST